MFIWDFVANPIMDALMDWFYSQIVGFLGAFFAQMGNMGAELFELYKLLSYSSPNSVGLCMASVWSFLDLSAE
jgi:hypothetical protein